MVAHWDCLAKSQRDEILKAVKVKSAVARLTLEDQETTSFLCKSCSKGSTCLGCDKMVLQRQAKDKITTDDPTPAKSTGDHSQDQINTQFSRLIAPLDGDVADLDPLKQTIDQVQEKYGELLFRCITCKRSAHYSCLPTIEQTRGCLDQVATFYQTKNHWQCHHCIIYKYRPEKIIAWRSTAQVPEKDNTLAMNSKTNLPREYLVKWVARGYRRTQWVPHIWLSSKHGSLLRNFLTHGSKIHLLDLPTTGDSTPLKLGSTTKVSVYDRVNDTNVRQSEYFVQAISDAECRINPLWKTVDRVLDVLFIHPRYKLSVPMLDSDENKHSTKLDSDVVKEIRHAFDKGEQPSNELTVTIEEWEDYVRRKINMTDIDRVIWAFIKWDDLSYGEGDVI